VGRVEAGWMEPQAPIAAFETIRNLPFISRKCSGNLAFYSLGECLVYSCKFQLGQKGERTALCTRFRGPSDLTLLWTLTCTTHR
jgi:hypothetical protein